jgi:3'(2'), 5'-bisphosphate nucleotidase
MINHPFIATARPLAETAAKRLMELRLTTLVKERKADRSLVTNADREADAIIIEGLRKAFPEHGILTEESGQAESLEREYVWVVDPLDGTKAYANGVTGFSVMIGVLKNRVPFAGVVVDPMEEVTYEAVRGLGSYWQQKDRRERATVSERAEWAQMPLITSTGFPDPKAELIQKALPCPWVPAVNSVGVKVGFMVRQLADIYVNHHGVHYWDTCAPQVILEEAGGTITFLDGSPLRYELGSEHRHHAPTLATNSCRHEEARRVLAPIMQGRG